MIKGRFITRHGPSIDAPWFHEWVAAEQRLRTRRRKDAQISTAAKRGKKSRSFGLTKKVKKVK